MSFTGIQKFEIIVLAFVIALAIQFPMVFVIGMAVHGEPLFGLAMGVMFSLWLAFVPSLIFLVTVIPWAFFAAKRSVAGKILYVLVATLGALISLPWGFINGFESFDVGEVFVYLPYYLLVSIVLVRLISNKLEGY